MQDLAVPLDDKATKIFLNTNGTLDDVNEPMQEFLTYIMNTTTSFAVHSKSELVKVLNKKVDEIKNNKLLEVEYMTLYERLEEMKAEGKIEGIEETKITNAKALLDILDDETISSKIDLPLNIVKQLREESMSE